MEINEQIADIIGKKLKGEASEKELHELEVWMGSDPANKFTHEQMVMIWEKSHALLADHQFDSSTAWTNLDNKIANLDKKRSSSVISLPYFKKLVAAAAILIAVITGWYIWVSTRIQWQTFAAIDNNQSVSLPDGSLVLLRKGSSIEFPAKFDIHKRETLLNGEAYFQVQHNANQPFVITTENAEVTVLGTSFLLNSSAANDKVVVVTGRVRVQDKTNPENQVILATGEKAVLQRQKFSRETVSDSNFLSWKTGVLTFQDAPLKKVLEEIEHFYVTPVSMAEGLETEAEKIHITVRFENQPIEQVLEEISLLSGLQERKQNDSIIFFKK